MARTRNYLNNSDMLNEFNKSKEQGKLTDELVKMSLKLAEHYAMKSNLSGYSYVDEMIGDAMLNFVKNWDKFDPSRTNQIFSYVTQMHKAMFFQRLKKEKKHRIIRDVLLVEAGMDPSWNFQLDNNSSPGDQVIDLRDSETE